MGLCSVRKEYIKTKLIVFPVEWKLIGSKKKKTIFRMLLTFNYTMELIAVARKGFELCSY